MKIVQGLKLFVLLFLIISNSLIVCFLKTSDMKTFRVTRKVNAKKVSRSGSTTGSQNSRSLVGLSIKSSRRKLSKRENESESEMAKFQFKPFEYDQTTVFWVTIDGNNSSNYANDKKKQGKNAIDLEDPSYDEMKTFTDEMIKVYKDAKGKVDDDWNGKMYTFLRIVLVKKGNWTKRNKTQQLQIFEYLKASDVKAAFYLLEHVEYISSVLNKTITSKDDLNKVRDICTEVDRLHGGEESNCKLIIQDIQEIETEAETNKSLLESSTTTMNIPTKAPEVPDNDKINKLDLACKRAMADAMPPKFCWRQGGQVIPDAPTNFTRYGLLYYENCPPEKPVFFGGFCRIQCDESEYTLPEHCAKKGVFLKWRSRQASFATIKNMFDSGASCPSTMPNRIGALCYRDCPTGTTNCGCCACSTQCAMQIVKMVVSIVSGLAKLVLFILTAGAGGVATATLEPIKKGFEIAFSVSSAVLNLAGNIVDALADSYVQLTTGKSESEGKAAFTKLVYGIGWVDYLKGDKMTGSKETNSKDFKDKCQPQIEQKWNQMKKAKDEKDARKSADEILKQIYLDVANGVMGNSDSFKLWESKDSLMSINGSTVLGTITSLVGLYQQVSESSGSSSENVETAKLIVGVIENWDPTGITSMVNAVLHPLCKDDPKYNEEGTRIAGITKKRKNKKLFK